jgi:hypothetical protein
MATVTPNFNWPVPTSTDLVKDGATAIEALGDSIDASLVDLKGGTTGQVLAKASNTDMDFSWVAQDDSNAIQNTIVDAKGDLIAASAADTPARLAVGNNGETLVADSSTSTGLRYQSGYNGNAWINGGFDIWQRGTSIASTASPASGTYTADRFRINQILGKTVSRQASGLTGIQYCARVQRDSGGTSTAAINFGSDLETADTLRFAGQTVTFSFYARAGANYSSASSALGINLLSGTGTDQNSFQGFTNSTAIINQTATLTTSWQRFSYTVAVASNVTQLGTHIYYTPVGTAGANDYFEITGVQLELGSVATAFKRSNGAGGNIQGELAACQRYYYRAGGNAVYETLAIGRASAATSIQVYFQVPVPLRTNPNLLDYATLIGSVGTSSSIALTTANVNQASKNMIDITMSFTGASFTTGGMGQIQTNNSLSGYLAVGAEL